MDQSWLAAAGGVGFFLLGMAVMTQGLQALAGDSLSRTLQRFTRSPVSGAVTGAATTAVLQSSSATTVAAVGFAGAGLLTFAQALGIVFGANIGTTLTGWIVALLGFKLDLAEIAAAAVLGGMLLHLFGRGRFKQAGLALAGFALVFVGIGALKDGMSGLTEWVTPESFPADGFGGRILLVGLGVLMTIVTQSSSAGVAMAIAALHSGAIGLGQAAALVIGMDVGTTFSALLATLGGSTQARRTGYAHVIYNLLTGIGAFLLMGPYLWALDAFGDGGASEPELALVVFHTGFNTLGVIAVLPFARPFAAMIERLVPERGFVLTAALDERILDQPRLAIEAARSALRTIASQAFEQFTGVLGGRVPRRAAEQSLREVEAAVERLSDYLDRVSTDPEQDGVHARHLALMHASDHVDRFAERAARPLPDRELARAGRLQPALDDLGELLAGTVEEGGVAAEDRAEALWQRLQSENADFRRESLRRAARGDLDDDEAIAAMDAFRNVRRIAYHAWRILHHLNVAAQPVAEMVPGTVPVRAEVEPD